MADIAFQIDAFDTAAFQAGIDAILDATEEKDTASFEGNSSTSASLSVTEPQDNAAFNATAITSAALSVSENKDDASFNITSTTAVTFNTIEQKDTASFNGMVSEDIFGNFNVTEQKDTASFTATSITSSSFSVTEAIDTASFGANSKTIVTFSVTEAPDVAGFRTFVSFFTEGDAYYIDVRPEVQTITILPANDRGNIQAEFNVQSIPDEWQRIDVDQQSAYRKGQR